MAPPDLLDDAPTELADLAHRIRTLVLEQTVRAGGGYLAQACSSAEILATLYGGVLRLGPSAGPSMPEEFRAVPGQPGANPSGGRYHGVPGADTDRFIVSPSHYALAVYAALVAVGRLAPEALASFNTDGSTLEMIGAEHSPGFELTTGSMGQALSVAAGIALTRRWRHDSGDVWVFLGDGELQEGQVWEALQFAAASRLANLRIVVDVNGQQVDGRTEDVLDHGPLDVKFAGFGCEVRSVDGHDLRALRAAARTPLTDRPLVVLAATDPSHGIELLRTRAPRLHYVRFRDADEHAAYAAELAAMQVGEVTV